MNTTRPGGRLPRPARRYEAELALAPHVEPAWAEEVILELRLAGVSGERIGAALVEVDAHCVDSGEPAAEAFGDPVRYARSLELPTDDGASRAGLALAAAPPLVQVLGMLVVLAAVPALRRGESVALTVGHLGMLAVLVAAVGAVVAWSDTVLRVVVERPVVTLLGVTGVLGAGTALLLLGTGALVAVSAGLALGGGVAVLAAGVAWHVTRADDDASPLVAPTGEAPPAHGSRGLRLLVTWQVPVATAVLAAAWWFTA